MKRTQALHDAGQSIWLDNITRTLLDRGILDRYIARYSVTGLTSNPTILDNAIKEGTDYDADIAARKATGASDEEVVFELALADLRRAADKFAPIYARTDGVDGWVSLEVSPLLAHNAQSTIEEATALCRKGARGNLFIKIPGTAESLPAIEECIYSRIPVNVTLLFSAEQYEAAAEAYLRGVERRIRQARTRPLPRSPRCSCHGGTRRWPGGYRRNCATGWASPWPSRPTGPTGSCWTPRAGGGWPTRARGRSDCYGPPPRSRIPRPPTCCM